MSMTTVIIEVKNDKDISVGRYLPWELSLSKCRLQFMDAESREVVEVLYWDCEDGISVFPNASMMF